MGDQVVDAHGDENAMSGNGAKVVFSLASHSPVQIRRRTGGGREGDVRLEIIIHAGRKGGLRWRGSARKLAWMVEKRQWK